MAALPPTRSRKPYVVIAVVAAVVLALVAWRSGDDGVARDGKRVAQRGNDRLAPSAPLVFRDGKWQRPVPGRRLPHVTSPPADGLVRVTGTVVDAASGKAVPDVEVVFAD